MSRLMECQRVLKRVPRPVFIAAGDRHEARDFAVALGLGGDEWVYVLGENDVMGVQGKLLFVILGYQVPRTRRDVVSWWWRNEYVRNLRSVCVRKEWRAELAAEGSNHE